MDVYWEDPRGVSSLQSTNVLLQGEHQQPRLQTAISTKLQKKLPDHIPAYNSSNIPGHQGRLGSHMSLECHKIANNGRFEIKRHVGSRQQEQKEVVVGVMI